MLVCDVSDGWQAWKQLFCSGSRWHVEEVRSLGKDQLVMLMLAGVMHLDGPSCVAESLCFLSVGCPMPGLQIWYAFMRVLS